MAFIRTWELVTGTGQTVDAATVDLITYAIPTGSVVQCIFATHRKAADISGRGSRTLSVFKNVAGTVTEIPTAQILFNQSNASVSTAAMATVISGTNVIFRGTGVAGQTIQWFIWLSAVQR